MNNRRKSIKLASEEQTRRIHEDIDKEWEEAAEREANIALAKSLLEKAQEERVAEEKK